MLIVLIFIWFWDGLRGVVNLLDGLKVIWRIKVVFRGCSWECAGGCPNRAYPEKGCILG